MKVVRVVSELDFGGIEKVVELVSLELLERKSIEFCVVVLSRPGRVSRSLEKLGVPVHYLGGNPKIPNFFLLLKLTKLLKSLRPDVVHCAGAEANFHGIFASFFAGVKVRIGEEVGLPNHHFIWARIFQITYCFASRVIAVSPSVQFFITNKGEVARSKTVVLDNPVQIFDAQDSLKGSVFTFIAVSRLVPIKNLENLILVFSRLKSNKKRMIILGDGELKEDLINFSKSVQVLDDIEFVGYKKEVDHFFSRAHCYVLPSYSEGSPVALAEAMMAGLPSIVTNIGGGPDTVGDSESAIFIDPYNLKDLQEAMEHMMQLAAEQRERMGNRARAYALKNYSRDAHVDHLLRIYNQLLRD